MVTGALVVTAVVILFALFVAVLLANAIARPAQVVVSVLERIAATISLVVCTNWTDELRDMDRRFNPVVNDRAAEVDVPSSQVANTAEENTAKLAPRPRAHRKCRSASPRSQLLPRK
jgi:methyl-accepting chemotaxis protein